MNPRSGSGSTRIDRYELYDVIASGGMATVHLGRLIGPAGFGRTVAIKRLHSHLAKEPEFVTMLTDEARVAGRIGHRNIVPTLDVVASQGELFLVMEYVPGLTLSALMKQMASSGERLALPIACAIMVDVLHGLHAVHEARDESGRPLDVVHRDVSPQNILVGSDGVTRVLDFGIAKAAGRLQTTRDGQLKGKVGYMAPEQLGSGSVDRRTDIYAASVVFWEVLTGERLFDGDDPATVFGSVMQKKVAAPSTSVAELPPELDSAILTGLNREPSRRFARARDMAMIIEKSGPVARASEIAEWISSLGQVQLTERARRVADVEARRVQPVTEVITRSMSGKEVLSTSSGDRSSAARPKQRLIPIMTATAAFVALGTVIAVTSGGRSAPPPTPTSNIGGAAQPGGPVPSAATLAAPSTVLPSTESLAPQVEVPAELDPHPAPQLASPVTPSSARAKALAARGDGAPRPTAPKSRNTKQRECDPPFTIDEQGHKHYKLDCL